MKQSLEYCSLHYLNIWLKHDMHCHQALKSGTDAQMLDSLTKAATYYKVARNLLKENDEKIGLKRYEPVLRIIKKTTYSGSSDNPINFVCKIQNELSKAYGNRNVLSATTKFLWLKINDPIIIYDSQVRSALNTGDDFPSFYKAWHSEYNSLRDDIASVCKKLKNVSAYAFDKSIATTAYVHKVSAKAWFHKRVFDVYLWHKGK